MTADRDRNAPAGFGSTGMKVPVVTQRRFDAVEDDLRELEASVEDVPLSDETISARNRFFIASLAALIISNSKEVEIASAMLKVKFDEGIRDVAWLSFAVSFALGAHYAFAAASEYISEGAKRKERMERIKASKEYILNSKKVIENKGSDGVGSSQEDALALASWSRRASILDVRLACLERRHNISRFYSVAVPAVTVIFFISLLVANLVRASIGVTQ